MNNFISGNNLNVYGDAVISGDISQNVGKRAVLGEIVSESILCNGDIHADNLTIYNDFSIAGQLSTNSILTNNLDTQYIRLNGETVDLSSLSKLSDIDGSVSDFVNSKINLLIGGASSQFDTLKEIQTIIESNQNVSNTLIQYQNKVDKYDSDGVLKNFAYVDKNNNWSGVQNFTGSVITGITKDSIGLNLVNNSSDLDKPISNAVFSELVKKLDKSIYDSFVLSNTSNLNLKLDKSIYDAFLTSNTSNLNLKVDKSIYDTFLTSNTSNLNLKLDKSIYEAFVSTNTSNLNLKLDKSIYDLFVTSITNSLNSKINSSDFFDVVDLKLNESVFNSYQLASLDKFNNITGITYSNINNVDLTSIDNNVEITKTLKINGLDFLTENTNLKNRITSLETDNTTTKSRLTTNENKLSGISYDSTTDTSTVDNNLIVTKSLYIGDNTYDVKSKIDSLVTTKANLSGNNTFTGNQTISSDTIPLKLLRTTNSSTNSQLGFVVANNNGDINPIVQPNDFIIFSGFGLNSDKNSISIVPWTNTKSGIRITSNDIELGSSILKLKNHSFDTDTNTLKFYSNSTVGLYEFYNGSVTLANKLVSIGNTQIDTYRKTSLCNGNFVIDDSIINSNKKYGVIPESIYNSEVKSG